MTFLNRMARIATASALAVGGTVAVIISGAPAANASPGCAVTPHVPSRLAITTGERDYAATITGCTGDLGFASVDLSRVGGPSYDMYGLSFDGDGVRGGRTATFTVYDLDKVGTYKTVGGDGLTKGGYSIAWHSATTSLRYGSWTSISTKRVASNRVSVTTSVSHYVAFDGRVHYPGRLMTFQTRHSIHDPWKTFAYVRTNSAGRATATHRSGELDYYRVVLTDTSTVWGSASGTSRR